MEEVGLIGIDLIAGTWGGILGLALTHPLDTIRIRMQLQTYPKIYKTWVHCGAMAIKKEGPRGLFKGVLSYSIGSSPVLSLWFASKEFAHRIIKPLSISEGSKSYLSGCFAGLIACSATVPSELLKWRAQANKVKFINYRSSIRKILNKKGISGLYQGFLVTAIRDIPWCGFYFWTYETIWRKHIKPEDSSSRKYTIKIIAGGLAGWMDWVPTYPMDVVKTKIQIDKSVRTPGIIETMVKYYKLQGPRFFFKGIIPTWVVAFPCNAIIFLVYDEIVKMLGKENIIE